MRCIRPPQSQYGTNDFLKTSVYADGSQHLHEKNRINSFFHKKAPWIFFCTFFICLWFFGLFSCLKTLFLDFHPKNFFVKQILKWLTVKNNLYWQNQLNLFFKSWNNKIKKYSSYPSIKKIIKYIADISFNVFNGQPQNNIEDTKTFFGQMFYYYLSTYMKFFSLHFWGFPGQSTKVFRPRLKNIFFHEKRLIYIILRYMNLFFNTFFVLDTFFNF